jgi:hypothetical protein
MILVGLTGKKSSGKDTVAQALIDEGKRTGMTVVRRGFADSLKLSVCRLFHPEYTLEEAVAWADALKSQQLGTVTMFMPQNERDVPEQVKITGRELLQRYGTEAHRDVFGFDFWADQLLPMGRVDGPGTPTWESEWQFAHGLDEIIDVAVVSDVRFENEASRICVLGGDVICVERPRLDDGDAHVSEVPIESRYIAQTIPNDGTIEELRAKASLLLHYA